MKNKHFFLKRLPAALLIVFCCSGCFKVQYGTNIITIPSDIETVSVQYFDNRATRVEPGLSQSLTDELKAYIESNTKLRMVNTVGDVDFSGEITDYRIQPSAISAGDMAAKTKFTITVRVKYTNAKYPDDSFDQSFSRYREFDASKDFSNVEAELTEEIIEELIDQIYNKAFVNW